MLDAAEAACEARQLNHHALDPENDIRILVCGPALRTIIVLLIRLAAAVHPAPPESTDSHHPEAEAEASSEHPDPSPESLLSAREQEGRV